MIRRLDPEVLAGFVEEVKSYLPLILEGIDSFSKDSANSAEVMEEAYRYAHSIKGSASMVGLTALSHLAYQLEEHLERMASRELTLTPELQERVLQSVAVIDDYLTQCLRDPQHPTQAIEEMTRLWKGEPVDASQFKVNKLSEPTPVPAVPPIPEDTLEAPSLPNFESPEIPEPEAFNPPLPPLPPADEDSLGFPPVPVEPPTPQPAAEESEAEEAIAPELLEIFALESEEHLRTISTLLPQFQQQPTNKKLLQEIRRSTHTLKGAAAMVGFRKITQLSHRMEDLLDQLYESGRVVTPEIIALLFQSADALEDLAGGRGNDAVLRDLYARYAVLLSGKSEPIPVAAPKVEVPSDEDKVASPVPEPVASEPAETEADDDAVGAAVRRTGEFIRVPIARLDDLVKLVGELVISRSEFEQRLGNFIHQVEELQLSTSRLHRTSNKLETQYEARTLGSGRLSGLPTNRTLGNGNGNGHSNGNGSGLIPATFQHYGFDDLEFDRYTDFHLLSRELSETTSDIRTVGNELLHLNGDFDSYLTRQTRLTSELQDKLMRIRMVPLSTLANRLHRTVRNVATGQQKQVKLILDGEKTELDKTVLEEMAEPLMHLLRNAVDHGIEPSDVRVAQGKPAVGTVRVRAFPEGTQVAIQISDDGGGINPEKLRNSAIEKGFVTPAETEQMSDEELLNLIFIPGFSTAKSVTEVSGRGVGMDIVRALVLRLKGTIAIQSKVGEGTTFTIRLPLTLAIMRSLLVRTGGQTFAVPLAAVTQLLRLEPETAAQIGDQQVVRAAGKVYPRVYLGRALRMKNPIDESIPRPPVVILNAGDREIALVVDQLIGGREIVVKNLGNHIRRLPGVSGATLMGDGTVVLIINPADLLPESQPADRPIRSEKAPASILRVGTNSLRVMVVDDSPSVRRIVCNLLKPAGWEGIPAKDGVEALELLHRDDLPDAMILDIEMPRMDGYELLSTLRGNDAYKNIPVVMVTSRAGEKHRRKAMDLGANEYLVKPYQDEVLLETIRRMIAKANANQAVGV